MLELESHYGEPITSRKSPNPSSMAWGNLDMMGHGSEVNMSTAFDDEVPILSAIN